MVLSDSVNKKLYPSVDNNMMTLKYPVWIMLQHRKLEVTALNEKSE